MMGSDDSVAHQEREKSPANMTLLFSPL